MISSASYLVDVELKPINKKIQVQVKNPIKNDLKSFIFVPF